MRPIRIQRETTLCGRPDKPPPGQAFKWVYWLDDSGRTTTLPDGRLCSIDYKGTELASIRQIAKKLAREQARVVVEDF